MTSYSFKKNTRFFLCILFVSVFTYLPLSAQKNETAKKPNIIYILVDDLGYGDVGVFYQNKRNNLPRIYTPWLDKMAADGAFLTHSYANAPVCVSSRSSLLLGVTQGHATVRNNQFDKAIEDNHTLGNTLQQAGYATAAIGKWGLQGRGNKKNWVAHPLNRGFDYYFGYIRHGDGHEHYPKEGLYRGAKEVYDAHENITQILDKCYTGDLWTARAKQWILDHKKANKSQPFFMYLAYDTPHAVLELPTGDYPAGGGKKGGVQWTGKPGKMINTAIGEIDSWIDPQYINATYDHDNNEETAEIAWPDVYKRYATIVTRLDRQVGDVLQLLEDLKIGDNTFVVFTSDNGPSKESYLKEDFSPEFFRGYGPFDGIKRDVYEGGLRVPTIVKWPKKIKGGKEIRTAHMSSDWMTTFLEVAGYIAPARADGVSLLPALTGQETQRPTQVYIEYVQGQKTTDYQDFEEKRRNIPRKEMQMIRIGNYAGVRYDIQSETDDFEIYDVVTDPKQIRNLAEGGNMAILQKTMKERVLQIRRPDTAAHRPYDNALVPPIQSPAQNLLQNLHWGLYKINMPWVSNPTGIEPLQSGQSKSLQIPQTGLSKDNLLLFEGFIHVPTDGEYTFYMRADGKSFMRIHDAALFDLDYGYTSGTEKSEVILLKAGIHPVKIYYQPQSIKSDLKLEWTGPDFGRKPVY
ncbi:MAG TPA: sulfatase-like hydrolase/transferase [Sphingobacterium sp.]|nr:sulfatase-like hydrolase/transferase [Sphingobacterium sp.]